MEPEMTKLSEKLERSLIEITVESWRFTRVFLRMLSKVGSSDERRYSSQLRYFHKKLEDSLEEAGLRLVNVEGQAYEPGMAATAINLGDFGPDDTLVIDHMVEPIIMGPEGVRRTGTVMLRKV